MKLKICGMRYQDNIDQVVLLQPDYLGFIFYKKSTRYFTNEINKLPKNIKKTGVFVNEDLKQLIEKVKLHNLQAIQLHGNESAEYCNELKHYYQDKNKFNNGIEIIKVFSIKNEFNFDALKPYESTCDYYLFDTKGELPGGNGYTFNWSVLNNYPSKKPFFLSGGIGINEVEKLKKFKQSKASKYCYAIDVNSKFEIKPGLKDFDLLKTFKNNITTKEKHN